MMQNDQNIQEGLMKVMVEHPKLDTKHLHLDVKDAVVFIRGTADTEEEKKLAEQLARNYPGVVKVNNELHVATGFLHTITSIVSGIAANNDEEIHKKDKTD